MRHICRATPYQARSRAFSLQWLEPHVPESVTPRRYYNEINLHLVWRTKDSSPLLTPDVETATRRFLKRRIMETPGAYVHEIGGIEDHVHLAVAIPPTIAPATWIGELKGGTARDVNQWAGQLAKVLRWQAGYGVVSFGTRNPPWVVEYMRNQWRRHTRGATQPRLERVAEEEASP